MFSLLSSYGHRIMQPTSVRVEMEKTKARLRTKRKVFVCKKKTKRGKKSFYTFLRHSLLLHLNILPMNAVAGEKKNIKLKRN